MRTKGPLKILCIADHVDPLVYTTAVKERFGDVDAVLSCGDLNRNYYEFIVSMLNVPFVYVLGNHSPFSLDSSEFKFYSFSVAGGRWDNEKRLFIGGNHADGKVRYIKNLDLLVGGFGGLYPV